MSKNLSKNSSKVRQKVRQKIRQKNSSKNQKNRQKFVKKFDKKFVIKRVVVSTYQSISGTGKKAVEQLENEEKGVIVDMAYPHQIYKNALPHCDVYSYA